MTTAESRDGFDDFTVLNPTLYQRPEAAERESGGDYTEHYTLKGTVGVGGVGRVLLAFDERIGREVAIKEMLDAGSSADTGFRARFLREARITGRLEHPGIVPIYDVGTSRRGSPYYVMRFVRGDTLARALADCNKEVPEQALARRLQLLDRLIDVCEAMAYAHSRGVIHRDLKPGNIVLGPFGETIILDWGLAKVAGEADARPARTTGQAPEDDEELTQVGDVLGTPAYMAPEQVDARFGTVDARTDVFALGSILFVLLMGRPALQGGSREILERIRSGEPMPSSRRAGVAAPRELTAICDKALNCDPAHRYRDAGELAAELRAYRDGRLVSTYAYSRRELLRRFVSRNRLPIVAGALVLLAILAGAGLAFQFALEADRARELAQTESVLARQAQQRAEATLAEVSRIANSNLVMAQQVGAALVDDLGALRGDMEQIAALKPPVADRAAVTPLLEGLMSRNRALESLAATVAPGRITAVVPDRYAGALGADTSGLEHNILCLERKEPIMSRVYPAPEGFLAITLVIPVLNAGGVEGFLSARVKPAEFLRRMLPPGAETERRKVWIIQDDGLILYDSNAQEIGNNLFRPEAYARVPGLHELADAIAGQPTGVGHYRSDDGVGASRNQLASWVMAAPTANRSWKVVVLEDWSG